jgi:uncharacterized protein (DUF1800 family)
MQLFLSLSDNDKNAPNENYARELMELFTLGAGYTEHDIREAARALTGWRPIKDGAGNVHSVVFARSHHDNGVKQIFGHRGRIGTSRVLDLVTTHRKHAPFITRKLWDFFVTRPPDGATATALVNTYRSGNGEIKPVVAQILTHPFLYADLDAPDMVKCPVVYVAGHLRTTGSPVTSGAYTWLLNAMGQLPFRPPSVAGWDWGTPWLSTGAVRARFALGNHLLGSATAPLPVPAGTGDPALSPEAQLEAALAATGRPWISPATRATLTAMAAGFFSDLKPRQRPQRAKRADMLQRVLRHLLLTGPDAQLH